MPMMMHLILLACLCAAVPLCWQECLSARLTREGGSIWEGALGCPSRELVQAGRDEPIYQNRASHWGDAGWRHGSIGHQPLPPLVSTLGTPELSSNFQVSRLVDQVLVVPRRYTVLCNLLGSAGGFCYIFFLHISARASRYLDTIPLRATLPHCIAVVWSATPHHIWLASLLRQTL